MVTAQDLRQNFQPYFIEGAASEGNENVTLVSTDKKQITISACVFASVNPWCCELLKSVDIMEREHYFVITELSTEELMIFKTFATTGKVFGFKSAEELLANQSAVSLLTFGYGTFGQGSDEKPDFSETTELSMAINSNTHVKAETIKDPLEQPSEEPSEEPCVDPLNDDKTGGLQIPRKRKTHDKETPTTGGEENNLDTDNDSTQEHGDYDPDWRRAKPKKKKKVVKEAKIDPKTVNYWKHVAKKEAEEQTPCQQLSDGEAPKINSDGSISFPNGYCLNEWKAYQSVMKLQTSRPQFLKKLLTKAFGKELPWPMPDQLNSEFSKAQSMFYKLSKSYKSRVDRHKVCFKINPWDQVEDDSDEDPDWKSDGIQEGKIKDRLFFFPPKDTEYKFGKGKPYQCHLCAKGYDTEKLYQQHLRRHEAKSYSDRFFCLLCTDYVAFPSLQDLQAHKREVHPSGEPYREEQCVHCPKLINNQTRTFEKILYHSQKIFENNWKTHMQAMHGHPDGIQSRHMCVSCGAGFNTKQGISLHIKKIGPLHDGKCRLCPDFEAKTWSENLTHFNKVHEGEQQYKCGHCPAHFPSESLCRTHRFKTCAHRKQPTEPYTKEVCSQCGISVRPNYMEKHLKRVHGGHSIPCTYEGCTMIIKHPDAVKDHIRLSHSYTTCELCGKTFQSNVLLNRHRNMAHTDNDKKKYKCETCGKGFGLSTSYKDHLNIHLGLKPYACKFCNAAFASSGTLVGHVRAVHRGIKRKT